MLVDAPSGVTTILKSMRQGGEDHVERLVIAVYGELRRRARQMLARERPGHTLAPTELVHEAYTELFGEPITCKDSAEFFALATTKLSRRLIDHARRKLSAKHGGNFRRCVENWHSVNIPDKHDLLTVAYVGELLTRLESAEPRRARVIEMKYFLGLTQSEIAELLGVSIKTIEEDLRKARAQLRAWATAHGG